MLPDKTVIPDEIEPVYGFKWLHVYGDGALRSQHGFHLWPHERALVAECSRDWGHEWVPRERELAQPKIEYDEQGTNFSTTTGTVYVPGQPPRPFRGEPWNHEETRLKIELPASLQWSWEACPCPHEAPEADCSCGIYVGGTAKSCENYRRHGTLLVRVALWGTVIRGSDGARGQFAYPVAICRSESVDEETIKAVRTKYEIETPTATPPARTTNKPPTPPAPPPARGSLAALREFLSL